MFKVEETKKALNDLAKNTFCCNNKEKAKYIYGAKYPELCRLPPTVINNIAGIATGNYTL